MKRILIPVLLAIPLVVLLLVMLKPWQSGPDETDRRPLLVHVGGTMRPIMEALADEYTRKTGQPIEINKSGSAVLLENIQQTSEGDVYICHDPFGDMLMDRKLGIDEWIVAELTPVIIVPEGKNEELKIRGVGDLTREDIKLGFTDYRYSTLGWMLPRIFERAGIDFAELNEQKDIFTSRSGGDVASRIETGTLDAAMVWNAVAHLRQDKVDVVPIGDALPVPYVDAVTSATGKVYNYRPVDVTVATLKTAKLPAVAADFARFVVSPDNQPLFEEYGFTVRKPVKLYDDGKKLSEPKPVTDNWTAPGLVELKLYAGAGLRPALEELIAAFEEQMGVAIEADYGGSGIVQARAEESRDADLFMPGDAGYVEALEEQTGKVADRETVSYFVPVIIKGKGLDKRIESVEDFFRDDVSVALGRKQVCQIGNASEKILARYGRQRSELGDIKESSTVNELGNWVKMGSVDASIVWDAIATNIMDDVEVVEIPPDKNAISTVVIALLESARRPAEARLFMDFLVSGAGRKILRANGYRVDRPYPDRR
jgi:molybdate transport system substrate-binding protein